jgi:hypothetical protein
MIKYVEFKVLKALVTNVAICWYIAPCSPYMNLRPSRSQVHMRTSYLLPAAFLLCLFLILKVEAILPSKQCFTYGLHGALSQRMVINEFTGANREKTPPHQ